MAGVREKYGDERVPVLALKAGVDQLLMPPSIDVAYNAVLDAVRSGELTEKRIDRSVYRILRLKHYRGLFRDPFVDVDRVPDVVGTEEHLAAAQDIADRSVTLVKNDAGLLPLDPSARDVLVTGWGVSTTGTVADEMRRRGAAATTYETGLSPTDAQIETAASKAAQSDLVVVTTNKAWSNSRQQTLVQRLLGTGTPVVVLAVRDPYDIAHFTEAPTYLATYSYAAPSLRAAAKVMYGEVSPTGKLPVTVPEAGDPDTALYPFGHGLGFD
jgi:beta-N-acetylhexosaminidase